MWTEVAQGTRSVLLLLLYLEPMHTLSQSFLEANFKASTIASSSSSAITPLPSTADEGMTSLLLRFSQLAATVQVFQELFIRNERRPFLPSSGLLQGFFPALPINDFNIDRPPSMWFKALCCWAR